MKYDKRQEHRSVARVMTFVNQYGQELENVLSYDTDTSIAIVQEPEDGPGRKGKLVLREKFFPGGMMVVDDLARPDEADMERIREKKVKPET